MTNHENGISGIVNLGNTCFINSTLQCLSHTHEIFDLVSEKVSVGHYNNTMESQLLKEWIELRELMWSKNCIVSPKKFLNALHNIARIKDKDIFSGYAQNDLPEFILFMFDCFHESLKREVDMNISGVITNDCDEIAISCYNMMKQMYSKEYSEIVKLCFGIHVSEILSPKTGKRLHFVSEPFFMVDLPIPEKQKKPSLIDCFDLYTTTETMDEDNKWYNEKTKKHIQVNKKMSFFSLPDILVIDIKRFNSDLRKNNTHIAFPLENLDLSKYVIGYEKKSYVYDLYGVCNHMGDTNGGHYTAFVRSKNNKWYHFNDDNINCVNRESSVISKYAYCLFYRKKKMH